MRKWWVTQIRITILLMGLCAVAVVYADDAVTTSTERLNAIKQNLAPIGHVNVGPETPPPEATPAEAVTPTSATGATPVTTAATPATATTPTTTATTAAPPATTATTPASATPSATTATAPATGTDALAAGKKIYETKCFICHASGISGAPKFGDKAAWQSRLSTQTLTQLLDTAKKGLNAMPPKGTCVDCTDDQLLAAIEYMLSQSGINPKTVKK